VIVGACVSFTVIVNEQLIEFPDASLTEQFTVVVPFGKVAPEAGRHEGLPSPEQLSLAAGAGYVTTAEHWPVVVAAVIFAGQVSLGNSVSLITTVKLHSGPAFVVQFTVVVPRGNVEPAGGVQVTDTHAPVVVGAG
jgi:hypothetical protein